MKTNWRKTLFNLHLYGGLVVGAFLLVAALSGTVLALRPELDLSSNQRWWHLTPQPQRAPLDEIVRSALADYPQAKIDFVQFSPAADAAVMVRFRDREELFLDPYRLTQLAERNKETEFFYSVEKLHRYLFLGKSGQWITGTAALALAVMTATGIYLWWPKGSKGLKSAFALNRKLRGRAWNVNLHKVVGIYSAVMLSVAAFTGGAEFLNWVSRTYLAPPSTRASGRALHSAAPLESAGAVSYESVWQTARQAMAGFQIARLSWPQVATGPLQMEYVAADAPHANALSYLFLDGYTGKLLRSSPYAQETAASRFYLWLLPIHLGLVGGLFGRAWVVSGALGMAFLVVTGFWLYYRRKLNPIRRSAPVAAAGSL